MFTKKHTITTKMEDLTNELKNYKTSEMKSYCKNSDLSELHDLKLYLDDLYYNTTTCDMPDKLYDILKKALKKRDPDYIPPVGAKLRRNDNEVKLPVWLGSADTITPDEPNDLSRWIEKNDCDNVIVSDKLDGVSGTLTYRNGKKTLYTRGDGVTGCNISYILPYIDNIPEITDKDLTVRGELIIKKDIFNEKYRAEKGSEIKGRDRKYKNARNMVIGLTGAKTAREGMKDIDFVVYEIIDDSTMPKQTRQLKTLRKLGFKVVKYKKYEVLSDTSKWVRIHNKYMKEAEYDIDGIIVHANCPYDRSVGRNPPYMFAFKVTDEDDIHSAKVVDIEWNVTAWGHIVPVAILEPVELHDITIKRVTVSNAGLLKEKQIGPNAVINVTRSKEVIPFIVSVKTPSSNMKWPDIEYKWDKNNVHIVVCDETEDTKKQMDIKVFSNFFSKMNIKFVAEATVKKLYEAGFDTLFKIISASTQDLMDNGFKEKTATRISENISKGLHGVETSVLLGSSGVFGYGVGRKRINALLLDIPDIFSTDKEGLKDRVMEVEGFSDKIADMIVENLDNAIQFIDDIGPYVTYVDNNRISDSLVGSKFVFSGFRSPDLEEEIINRGGKTTTSVSKNTTAIVVASKESKQTGKVTKALNLGIPIYTKDEFIGKFIE